ncbi:MAG: hypothetical protein IPL97_04045 [Niastella sp.]|nr:hypothetical protein [Niastella sp.]
MKNKILFFMLIVTSSLSSIADGQQQMNIVFVNTADNKLIEHDSMYQNAWGEIYQIQKLKYYISEVKLGTALPGPEIYLINAFGNAGFTIPASTHTIDSISFLIGVDSLYHVSGAQEGSLDPLNDMYWAWNSGYVTFKLEGIAESSPAPLHKMEQHIGGFAGNQKTMRRIVLPLLNEPATYDTIFIEMNLDKYWQGIHHISIQQSPVLTLPGKEAVYAADNFSGMFSIKRVY